jgi:LPS sulfotransferase NodH
MGSSVTRFVILFPGRTGSTYLTACLSSHPAVVAEGERLVRRSARWQERWVRRLYDRPRPRGVRAVGFKTKLKDVRDLDAFADLLRERSVRVIELGRRNLVKLAVSTLNARRLKARDDLWNRTAGTDELGPLDVAPRDLLETIRACGEAQGVVSAYVARLELATLRLEYEDLLADREAWLGRVATFLEIPARAMQGDVLKATDDDLRVAIADFETIRRALDGGPYARHLIEDA